jgi:hypothetical protein
MAVTARKQTAVVRVTPAVPGCRSSTLVAAKYLQWAATGTHKHECEDADAVGEVREQKKPSRYLLSPFHCWRAQQDHRLCAVRRLVNNGNASHIAIHAIHVKLLVDPRASGTG